MATGRVAIRLLQVCSRTHLRPTIAGITTRAARGNSNQLQTRRTWPQPAFVGAYSQAAAASQSKIWNFDDIRKLAQSPDSSAVVIVDTREPGELQQTGRIPGAINIPITSAPDSFHIGADEFEDRFGYPRPEKDAEVVFYCKAGVRSRGAAGIAREAGWTKVGEYPGSWLDWAEKGGKVER